MHSFREVNLQNPETFQKPLDSIAAISSVAMPALPRVGPLSFQGGTEAAVKVSTTTLQ